MAKFTVTRDLKLDWRGQALRGPAGTEHRIPDSLYDEFLAEFVTNNDGSLMPGLTWVEDDEIEAAGGGEASHPNLATHDSMGLVTDAELAAHEAASDPHVGYALDIDLAAHETASDPHAGYQKESEKGQASGYASLDSSTLVPVAQIGSGSADTTKFLRGDRAWAVPPAGEGGGAPTDADYLVGTAHGSLSGEIVVGTSPGGELGGTWASPTVDATHSGSSHASIQTAAESTASVALAAHAAAADPHTGYLKESDFTGVDFLVGTATGITGSEIVVGTSPGGELGGTWASPTVDSTHAGSAHHAQAHSVTGADHTATGLTSGQIMQATGTASFGFAALAFSRGATIVSSAITAAINVIVWRAPFACTVTAVKGYRVGGSGATVNARRNGSSNHLASAVSLSSADTWTDGGSVQNTAYAAGDKLEIMVVSATGSPTQIAVQVDFTRP